MPEKHLEFARRSKSGKQPQRGKNKKLSSHDLTRYEFYRNAIALLPEPGDRNPGVAIMIITDKLRSLDRSCTCIVSRKKTCPHLLRLAAMKKNLIDNNGKKNLDDDFRAGIWHRLAVTMAEDCRETGASIRIHLIEGDKGEAIRVTGTDGRTILTYMGQAADRSRFIERCCPPPDDPDHITRYGVMEKLALLTLTENERLMLDRGYKTRGMAFRESFWYKLAYHCYREFGPDEITISPAVEETGGDFIITWVSPQGGPVFRMPLARRRVKRFLSIFEKHLSNDHGLTVHPIPLDMIFDVKMTENLDLEIQRQLRIIRMNGEFRLLDSIDLKRFQYDDLVYIPELNILADMVVPDTLSEELKTRATTIIKKSQIPAFIAKHEAELGTDHFRIDKTIKGFKILKQYDRIVINPRSIDRDWCWLSVQYGFGNSQLSLHEILEAREKNHRYIGTPDGWVDCFSDRMDSFHILDRLAESAITAENGSGAKFSKMDLLRIHSLNTSHLDISGAADQVKAVEDFLEMQPVIPLPEIKGMRSSLRKYQQQGTEWLWFLMENGFGGLLCDDMGLGKTHQMMALMLCLLTHKNVENPFLVVCPTTVMSHWQNKIREHAPDIAVTMYYGKDRDLSTAVRNCHVLLTSYGILFRDIENLRKISFTLAIFDEIQHIKNPRTKSYRAAGEIQSPVKFGMTGTPIENSLGDLKALMDLTVPCYLDSDEAFKKRYIDEIEADLKSPRRKELSRLITPFTLRRLKSTVLNELPEKIEDIRTCRLSEDQIKLYRDAIDSRRQGLLENLRNPDEAVPYIHIFALLTQLKQICDHPALMNDKGYDYGEFESGKWELFKELIDESIGSGQKVVVYSQFLGMIDIISDHLKETALGHVVLTGKTGNRGAIIDRFNTDPDCRVFVGSLKAGGVGIDLIAASIVIHYDRWWNAAKEDQATDRVHRIGQTRGVQVFKLVTEGTLEEKISAIIAKKRDLMNSVVKEDDPGIMKAFTREDLIELLALPASG